mgnify:CR=1 FL=1
MFGPCSCGSGIAAEHCCDPYLLNGQLPETPEQLMRSRYSAYARGGFGDYLLRTWFPATAQGLTAAQLSRKECDWLRLEVLTHTQQGNQGTVEFKAYYRDSRGESKILHEKSVFQRIGKRWFYVGGEVGC